MRPLHAARLLAALAAGGLCVRAAQTQTVPSAAGGQIPPAAKPTPGKSAATLPRGTRIGDVTVKYEGSVDVEGGDIIFHGPGVTVTTTDKQRDTQMLVVADSIRARQKTQGQETAQFIGNVHYTVRQKTKAGERVIQGTADRANYTAVNKTLRLTRNVNATLTDPARFDAPAMLRVGSLIVSENGSYQMTGEAATNDIRFTPHYEPVKPGAARAAPFQIGTAHVYGFTKGVMETGQSARFDGPQVTIDTTNAPEKTQNTLKAPHIVAQLQENNQRVEAGGGVQFNNRRADAGDNVQVIAGSADSALYVDAVREVDKATGKSKTVTPARLEINGDINATLTNPVSLREPAALTADHLTAQLGDEPRYVVTGAPAHTRFTLAPRLASRQNAVRQNKAATVPAAPANAGTPANAAAPNKEKDTANLAVSDNAALNNAVTVQNTAPPANGNAPAIVPANAAADADAQDDAANQNPEPGTVGKSAPPFVIGDLSASAFQTATYTPDKNLIVEGPKVRFTSREAKTKNYAEMLTPRLEADFAVSSVTVAANKTRKVTTLTEMRATNGVTYTFQKPLPSGKTEMLTGTGRTSIFTNSPQSQIVKVEGVSMAELTNPDMFAQPLRSYGDGESTKVSYDFLNRHLHWDNPKKDGKIVAYPRMDAEPKPAVNSKANAKKSGNKKR